MDQKIKQLSLFLVLLVMSQVAASASVALSNYYYRSWNGIIEHQAGGASSWAVNGAQTGSIGPVVNSHDLGHASTYASSDYLSLVASSSIDGSTIDQLGLDYVVAEANTLFVADLVITGETGNALLNIDVLYNEVSTSNLDPYIYVYGEQRIRIYDNSNELVFAYLHGVSNLNELDNILLSFDTTYRFEMKSSAYTNVDVGYAASNQRVFSSSLSTVSTVPIPGAALLFSSSLLGLIGIAKKKVT